jgi:hypothetical protein
MRRGAREDADGLRVVFPKLAIGWDELSKNGRCRLLDAKPNSPLVPIAESVGTIGIQSRRGLRRSSIGRSILTTAWCAESLPLRTRALLFSDLK